MYGKVLVPLDGSQLAECALPQVKMLAKDGAVGSVILLTVVVSSSPYIGMRPDFDFPEFDFTAYRNHRLDEARQYLDGVQSQLRAEGVKVEAKVVEGNMTADAIADFARQNGIDLIVVATHGYTGMKKLVFGSVALNLLHDSPIPVLLIRPESC